MQPHALGTGGPPVSPIGFGTMPLAITGRPDEVEAVRVIHAVLDAGVTLIDTADVYSMDAGDIGYGERLVAKALRTWSGDRDAVVVATKGGSTHPEPRRWQPNGRPEHIRRACQQSLKALQVEQIDLYQHHAVDPNVPYAESVGALAELRAEGLIRWVGISNVTRKHIAIARAIVPIQTVQNILSPFHRGALRRRLLRKSFVAYSTRLGLGILAHSPLGGSRLNHRLAADPVLRSIAQQRGRSPHAIALAWVRAQGPQVIPIPGARTVERALDSVSSAEIALTKAEVSAIDHARLSPAG